MSPTTCACTSACSSSAHTCSTRLPAQALRRCKSPSGPPIPRSPSTLTSSTGKGPTAATPSPSTSPTCVPRGRGSQRRRATPPSQPAPQREGHPALPQTSSTLGVSWSSVPAFTWQLSTTPTVTARAPLTARPRERTTSVANWNLSPSQAASRRHRHRLSPRSPRTPPRPARPAFPQPPHPHQTHHLRAHHHPHPRPGHPPSQSSSK